MNHGSLHRGAPLPRLALGSEPDDAQGRMVGMILRPEAQGFTPLRM